MVDLPSESGLVFEKYSKAGGSELSQSSELDFSEFAQYAKEVLGIDESDAKRIFDHYSGNDNELNFDEFEDAALALIDELGESG